MSRIESLNRRYAAAERLAKTGVEIIAVGDPAGARLNAAVRRLLLAAQEDGPGLWDDLVGAANLLRWRLVTQPVPVEFNIAVRDGAEHVIRQVQRLRGAVANDALLEDIVAATRAAGESDPPLGAILRRSIEASGPSECAVVAASRRAQATLADWLGNLGVLVLTAGGLDRQQPRVGQVYVVGPPRLFASALVTAPVAESMAFLIPAWFGDRSVPSSAISPYAVGAIRIKAQILAEGDASEPAYETPKADVEDDIRPHAIWGSRRSPDREPTSEEVKARKVLLSGGLAIWLDEGDRIRALDPCQPPGERVIYTEVAGVQAGTYLLLRQGVTERRALYQAAMALLGAQRPEVDATQHAWKERLAQRLMQHGHREVIRELRRRGVESADRAPAWTDTNLVRPQSDHDFEILLQWLGIAIQPTFGQATLLRRALYQASADIREQLERAVSAADLSVLVRVGHLGLDVQTAGFRGIMATRVLAIAPSTEVVARHDARVPFEDRSGQWLE